MTPEFVILRLVIYVDKTPGAFKRVCKFGSSRLLVESSLFAAVYEDRKGSFHDVDVGLVPVTEKKIGQFYSSDCYVIQYQIKGADGKKEVMIYFWLGSHSTSDDKAAAAVQAKDLDEKLGHTATQVKVVEGREPIHFRTLFKGLLVVHRRGKVSGYKEKSANWRSSIQCTALYQVHGSQALATYATQVQVMASSLNSADCFVLVAPMFPLTLASGETPPALSGE